MSYDKTFLNNLRLAEITDFDNIELIPLGGEDADDDKLAKLSSELPILPVRNMVLFPGMVIPITVGRQKSIRLVKKAYKGNRTLGVITQANPSKEDPTGEDLHKIGTVAHILKMIALPGGNTTIIVQGRKRFEVENYTKSNPNLTAKVAYWNDMLPKKLNKENKALIQSLREMASKILFLNPEIPREAQIALDNIESPEFLIHFLSANVNAEGNEKQQLLEIRDGLDQARRLLELMMNDIDLLEIKREIQSKASSDIDQQQRD